MYLFLQKLLNRPDLFGPQVSMIGTDRQLELRIARLREKLV
jgi:hypothetical protein